MTIDAKKRALEKLAFRIWKKRVKRGDTDANDEKKNWRLARALLKKFKNRYINL